MLSKLTSSRLVEKVLSRVDVDHRIQSLRKLNKFVSNEPVIIYGSGPSLSNALTRSPGIYSIATNHSVDYTNSPMYIFQDSEIFSFGKFINRFRKSQQFPLYAMRQQRFADIHYNDLQGFWSLSYPCTKSYGTEKYQMLHTLEQDASVLDPTTWSAGAQAVCAAYSMGFSPIIVVGFDCYPTTDRSESKYKYAFNHPKHNNGNWNAAKGGLLQHDFLVKYGKQLNVINCSEGTFDEKHDLDSVIKDLEPNADKVHKKVKQIYLDNINNVDKEVYLKKASWRHR